MAEIEQRLRSYWADVVATHPMPDPRELMMPTDTTVAYVPTRTPRHRPLRYPTVLAAAAAVVALVVGAVALFDSDSDDPPVIDAAGTEAVTDRFINAWVRGDGEAVRAVFTPGATFDAFPVSELPGRHAWYRAVGWEYRSTGCEVTTSSRGTGRGTATCGYSFENDLTRVLGREALTGSFLLLVVDGKVARATDLFPIPAYEDVWESFLAWVTDRNADDAGRMFVDDATRPRWDAASIALWERYVDEYVAAAAPYVARNAAICAAPHATLSGALAELRADPAPEPLRPLAQGAFARVDALASETDPGERTDRAADIRRRGLGLEGCVDG